MADPVVVPDPILLWYANAAHRLCAVWYFLVAAICMGGPHWWFGPTWTYFRQLPQGGWWLGISCLMLGCTMTYSLVRHRRGLMIWSMTLGAVTFIVAAFLLFAEGMAGRMGLMESWFMAYVAINIGLHAAVERARRRFGLG